MKSISIAVIKEVLGSAPAIIDDVDDFIFALMTEEAKMDKEIKEQHEVETKTT